MTSAKAQEGPEDEGVGEAGERALADDFGLEEDFPDEVADALADGEEMEAGSFFDWRILWRTMPKRRQKAQAEAAASAAKSSFSAREKCWGSARVGRNAIMVESHSRYSAKQYGRVETGRVVAPRH